MANTIEIKGLKETLDVFQDLAKEIGDKKASSQILRPAMLQAMRPVLQMAKDSVREDTGTLRDSLIIYVKRPSARDRKSRYITKTDTMIAAVITKPIPKKVKKGYREARKQDDMLTKKKYYEQKGYFWDARAVANEFGTKEVAAKPFLRPSLESNVQVVTDALAVYLRVKMEQYRSKTR